MRSMWILLAALTACGGADAPSTPAPAPAPAPAAAPAPAPEPAPAPAAKEADAGDVDLDALSDDEKLAKLMEIGENVYTTGGSGGVACVTCHMAEGQGVPGAFPPLKGEGVAEHMGDCKKHA